MASRNFPVAVIGIGVRLPGAENCDEFWKLMIEGRDTVDEFAPERAKDIDHVLSSFRGQLVDENKPFFTGSFFKSVDKFDPDSFQINPREALFIEPEQRFFLEVVWELLEDAGYASKIRGSNTGVYVGNTVNKYKYILNENHPSISHGNHSPFISSRVSYTHDLHGPAMMVATGCSSSLLAVHLACQGLLSGDCDMAVAGGITLDLLPISAKTDIWNQLGITGPHVKCRAFDASAKGIAKGEGCGVVLLKPLQKAVDDGDYIYGILEATTANQDGHSNGITAPHPVAQANMLHQAWKLADITPDSLGFFEAHGTGTELGDPIEISGITNAFRLSGVNTLSEDKKIPIGSVKANIGHLADGAAGVVGLIKSLLCLHKNKIPGAINFSQPNPHINWKKAPVFVNSSPIDWKPNQSSPRYASVSAFGLLGTNIHAVVKEYKPQLKITTPPKLLQEKGKHILCLAANSIKSLETFVTKLIHFFHNCQDKNTNKLRNVCYTLNTGREHSRFKFRAVLSAATWESMVQTLQILHQGLETKSFDKLHGRSVKLAVSFQNDIQCNTFTYLPDSVIGVKLVTDFLKCTKVNWTEIYQDMNDFEILPQLPTYAFDHIRLWPKTETPINQEFLQLEHKYKGRTDYHGFLLENTNLSSTEGHASTNIADVQLILQTALNESLNMDFDWSKNTDENLFSLGMDSLIFTQVSMKLFHQFGLNLTLAEFHKKPTFKGLMSLVKELILTKQRTPIISTHNILSNCFSDVAVMYENLGEALDEALGQKINWDFNADNNLFALGVDSLIYTHVNMKLREKTLLETPITMSELHQYPTFAGLLNILQSKLTTNMEVSGQISCSQNNTSNSTFPISFAQRRLWVMQEMVSNPCAYNATNCLKLTGDFHPKAFHKAINHTISKNTTFFTVFEDGLNGPKQKLDWNLKLELIEVDLKHLDFKAEEEALKMYNEDYRTPFDLTKGPLVRCTLYSLPNHIYYYTMVVHHIIFDGWSHFVFYNELWDAYRCIIHGKSLDEADKQTLYVDIATYEHQMAKLPSSKMNQDMQYWKKKLEGTLPVTTFPGDKKRPPVFTYSGKRITRFIDHKVMKSLHQISSNQHTTFMGLLSTIFALLKQYTGDQDLIIGTPIAGRYDTRSRDVIGCFINTLALRVNLQGNITFKQILDAVSKVCLEAFDHQQAPFDHLVSELNLARNTSITPVFSVNVCYHNTEMRGGHVDPPHELTVDRRLFHNDSSKWDMQFDFLEEEKGMRFTLEYYTDAFSDEYASCIVDSYMVLLNNIIEDPDSIVENLQPIIKQGVQTNLEKSSLMVGPKHDLGSIALPSLLLSSLTDHQSSIIQEGEQATSFVNLKKKISKLVGFLRSTCHLVKGNRVGILMENSTEAIESVLSCCVSGLVYVPLDISSPKARLEHICTEAEVHTVIFSRQFITIANHLQWTCPLIKTLFCINCYDFDQLTEPDQSPLMDTELWDCVASQAQDGIEGGGWKSSYTDEHMSPEEMSEYSNNIFQKLKPHIKPTSRVLEIGCASGLTTKIIQPHVGSYLATDLSQEMVKKLQEEYKEESGIDFLCSPADEVGRHLPDSSFDIIIMNSVIHCFPGHNYLKRVIGNCESMLSENGIIFIGDVMDLDLRDTLITSMKSFKAAYPLHRTKTEWNNELFVSRRYLEHLCETSKCLTNINCSRKIYTVPNELTEFRYDAILSKIANKTFIPRTNRYQTLALRDLYEAEEFTDIEMLANEVKFHDEAYILYTSGTTGTPKGVIISHESLLNYVQWAAKTYQFCPKTHTPFFAPLTFDFTVTSIFPPLLKGSNIHVYKNFKDSYQDIGNNKYLTIAKFSPLQLDMLIMTTKSPLSINTYILGGEELTTSLLEKLKTNKANSKFEVWNEYGPTEATVGCIVKRFMSQDLPLDASSLVTIGYPIDNTVVGVIRNNRIVKIGGKGILAIGGKGLCTDFAGTGEQKNNKVSKSFQNCIWGEPVQKMLITDDTVEVLPSFEMAYFGRLENGTVKINGIRVDINEIQIVIKKLHFVEAVWICGFDYEKTTFLGAAVKMTHSQPKTSWKKHIFDALTENLPLRSIPKVFIEVHSAPTNANGKLDTRFLKDQFMLEIQEASQKSTDGIKQTFSTSPRLAQVQRIWQNILPINFLPSLTQNFFFDLSGDSLQAIHLVRKMRDEGFKVSVTDIFQNPTIEQLLPVMKTLDEDMTQQEEDNIPFKPTPILEEYILNKREYPDYFALSALLGFHTTIDSTVLRKALRSVMIKHGSLRSKITCESGQVLQEVVSLQPEQPKILEVDFKSSTQHISDEPEFIKVCQQLDQSHSLKDGILVGAAVLNIFCKDGNRKCYGLLVVHHAAIDIVSLQQILDDLAVALKALSIDSHKEPILKPCKLSFRSYCNAVHAESSGLFAPEVKYWSDIQQQSTEAGLLVSRNVKSHFKTAKWFSKSIDATSLRSTSTGMGCSDEQVLLTAFGRAMAVMHGSDKTALCMESHGRPVTIDTTDTVGWCTSMYPFILNTPLKDDMINQVKKVGDNLKAVPNHGLGFGLLKSAGMITMLYPKVTFIFQGSLDASSKETFDGGKYQFDHIPWIEIMVNELRQRRFHRHQDEMLEFDLGFFAWIHSGELKFGCLFDEKTVRQEIVEEIVKRVEMNMCTLLKQVQKTREKRSIKLNIIPGFNIAPECQEVIRDALCHHHIPIKSLVIQPAEDFMKSLYQASTANLNIIIPRLSDKTQLNDLVSGINTFKTKSCGDVKVLNISTLPNTASLSNQLQATQITVDPSQYVQLSDEKHLMPLSRFGYTCLGQHIARQIRCHFEKTVLKIVAIDGDYTLWDGECAEGTVELNKGNIALQKYMIQLKHQGILLILLSKNEQNDINEIFENPPDQMVLKKSDFVSIVANWNNKFRNLKLITKSLNLGFNSCVFIDDNVLECEEMLRNLPEVLTLLYPADPELVPTFLDSLWMLDMTIVSAESSSRTAMYTDELKRQEQLLTSQDHPQTNDIATNGFEQVLKNWKMKLVMVTTTVQALRNNKQMYVRASELLHRTSQFKLNDQVIDLDKVPEHYTVHLVSLKDVHGLYGIISVCISVEAENHTRLVQWVVSCRALNRQVENRILHELVSYQDQNAFQIYVNKTPRNTPMLNMLKTVDNSFMAEPQPRSFTVHHSDKIDLSLHEVNHATKLEDLDIIVPKTLPKITELQNPQNDEDAILKLKETINRSWTPLLLDQASRFNMYPLVPVCKFVRSSQYVDKNIENKVKAVWIEVLNSSTEPINSSNFLQEGGTSFSAVFLVTKLQRLLNIEISIVDLLKNPRYEDFMTVILSAGKKQQHSVNVNSFSLHYLTAAQQRMLVMQETAPTSTAYVETVIAYVDHKINPGEIISEVVKHHPILKSIIKEDKVGGYVLKTTDENVCSAEEKLTSEENIVEFVSNTIPIISVISSSLAKFRHIMSRHRHYLVVHVHHIISDDVTLMSIKHTLHNLLNDAEYHPRNNSLKYKDYKKKELDYYQSPEFKKDEQYWKEIYKTLPPSSELLSQLVSGWNDSKIYNAKQSVVSLNKDTIKSVSNACSKYQITEFQFYLACTSIVLQQYIGQNDITLAIPVTTRSFGFQHTDGLFVNTLVPRIITDHTKTVSENIKHVSDVWLEALTHSYYQLDELTKYTWKQHGQSLNNFCIVMFNYLTTTLEGNTRIPSKHAKMPLSVDVLKDKTTGETQLIIEWAEELVSDDLALRMFESIVELFTKVMTFFDRTLQEASLLSKTEKQLIQSFSHVIDLSIDKRPCCRTIEEHVEQNSEKIAVICEESKLTYEDLNQRADWIAMSIINKVEPSYLSSHPIVLAMKKNEDAVAAILGVWKAGGHFLPVSVLNVSALKDIFQRCNPALVLTNINDIDFEQFGMNCPVLYLKEIKQVNIKPVRRKTADDDLAYIIRTSGSSGKPKQCKITHKSLQTMAASWKKSYKMTTFDVTILQWAPLSFDVFVGDLVRSLVSVTGTLVMCPDEKRLDVSFILNTIKANNVSLMEVTPQFGQQLVDNAKHGELDNLVIFVLGSDVVQSHLFNKIKSTLCPDQRLLNSYGMTEATIDSSYFEGIPPQSDSGTVPIGKPMPGVSFYIINSNSIKTCPVGIVGELYIGGDVLASGDVDLHKIEDSNMRCLKTGDAARWLPSGNVELLGRLDSMMKLRGFRISSTEIENKIASTSHMINSVSVLPMINDSDVEFLCAFIVLNGEDDGSVTKSFICQKLRSDLPYYMLPDIVHIINHIPLSINGKVDKSKLPSLTDLLAVTNTESALPISNCSSTKATLANLFAEAMGLVNSNEIDLELTFMEQGGHSLILLRFASLIKQATEYNIGIADIFSYPSISTLSKFITENQQDKSVHEKQEITETADIAITGVGMRLPGDIKSMSEFWKVLRNGDDLITDFPKSRKKDVLECMEANKSKNLSNLDTFRGAFLDNIDQFDNKFFKIAPGEAKYMSPEQRMFLQVSTEALAEARNISGVKGSKIGVFVSNCEIGYSELDHPDDAIGISGLMPGMVATRVAYQWDLKGPTMLVDTACSSSLMALKMACESICKGESEGALVGGVNIVLYPARSGVFGETGILSPDFHCRAFDRDATGTAVGEGVICLYLEPLQSAIQNGKQIYGVLKGVSSNSVGHGNGITAPTSSSQKHVIESALHMTGLNPSDISYIETHGTGTKLGDRIELAALSSIFNDTKGVSKLPIGAAKTTFGHLDSAAGMVGVLKVLATNTFRMIPPMHLFKHPHPELVESSLVAPKECLFTKTVSQQKHFIAGVSSFGLTGTNCHAIIAEGLIKSQTSDSSLDMIPLLLIGKDLEQVQKQITYHMVFIKETIIQSKVNTVQGMCTVVAKRLQAMTKAQLVQSNIKMVCCLRNGTQALQILDLVKNCTTLTEISELAAARNDIEIGEDTENEFINNFLDNGEIDIAGIYGNGKKSNHALGVYLDLYEPTRHWCDKSTSRSVATEGLLDILQQKITDAREMVRSLPLAATPELRDLEGRFCVAVIIKLLLTTKLKAYMQENSEITFRKAFKETGMLLKYDKLFYVMIRELFENYVVKPTGNEREIHYLDSFKFQCNHLLDIDPEPIAKFAMEKYPSWADCFRFPLYCSQYLTKVLWGKMSPLSVIYPQGDLNYMYQFDKLGDLIGDVYYNMYMQLIVAYAKQLSCQGRKVRVLEVGAGMGHVTRQLIPKLKYTPNIEYWFTDLGKAFVENAKTLFEDYLHMMKFSTFDITKSAPKQGLLGSYDIVISYNVIHTTESVMDSVVNLKSCLGEDGTLFIIESAKNETWATLAWGILDGWWYFKDYDLRPDEPMMEPKKMGNSFNSLFYVSGVGFSSVHSCPVDPFDRDQVEKFLFLCSAKPLAGELKKEPGWWETIDLKNRRHRDLEDDITTSTDTGVEDSVLERTAIHQELKQIWCELLGLDDIQLTDDFNSLGGESLLAIQMMTLVRKRIGYQLEIADTFGYPSLGALADYIADQLEASEEMVESATTEQWINISTPSSVSDIDESEINGTLLMFPGQGAQKPGMCISMKDSNEAKLLFERAEKILGYNILHICLKNDNILEERLNSTEFVQVALLVGCLAKLEQLKIESSELSRNITHVSGLSVGEFAALVYAEVITFEDAVKIVQVRGNAMEKEVRQSATGMVSVFGPNCDQLKTFLDTRFPNMKISTYLGDNQHTVAGIDSEVDNLVAELSGQFRKEMNIIDVRKLRVAGGFHSRFMENASKTVDPVIESVTFSKPKIPIIMNVTGEIVGDPQVIKSLVCEQLVAPVLWKQTVITAHESGVTNFIEVSPARVLSSIVKNRISVVKNCSSDLIVV